MRCLYYINILIILCLLQPISSNPGDAAARNHVNGTAIQDDTLWAATKCGLVKWNLSDSSFTIIPVTREKTCMELTCIFVDRYGNKWMGIKGLGAAMYTGDYWEYFDKEKGMQGRYVNDICQDSSGVIWLATNYGVYKIERPHVAFYCPSQEGRTFYTTSVTADANGRIWFGTPSGVSMYDGSKWQFYNEEDHGLAGNSITSLAVDKNGTVWAGGYGKLSCLQGDSWLAYEIPEMDDQGINHIAVDESNNKWLSYSSGLIRFRDKKRENYRGIKKGALKKSMHITLDKNNNMWVSTQGRGILRLNGVAITRFVVTEQRLGSILKTPRDLMLVFR
jgi:ligand-binding sensor domain-containing protein